MHTTTQITLASNHACRWLARGLDPLDCWGQGHGWGQRRDGSLSHETHCQFMEYIPKAECSEKPEKLELELARSNFFLSLAGLVWLKTKKVKMIDQQYWRVTLIVQTSWHILVEHACWTAILANSFFSRPGQRQGLLHKQVCDSYIISLIEWPYSSADFTKP